MIVIDLPADLNMEDDAGRGVARPPGGKTFAVGEVVVAGFPGLWSWAVIVEVSDGLVYFRRVSAAEASEHGELTVLAPAS